MENKNVLKTMGNWISTLLLGDTKVKIGEMGKDIEYIKDDIHIIKPDLKDVRDKVSGMVPQVEKLWQKIFVVNTSPLALNDKGKEILTKSKIKDIIDAQKGVLLNAIKEKKPKSAYDVQEFSKNVVEPLKENSEIIKQLKDAAFNLGVSVEEILFVGSIYLRDIALGECGFKPEDLDNH